MVAIFNTCFSTEKAKGVEIYTYLNAGAKAKNLAQKIQTSLVALGFINSGVKEANFHVLRETRSPSVLVEIGFIDNTIDNKFSDSKRSEIIKAISKSILLVVGIK